MNLAKRLLASCMEKRKKVIVIGDSMHDEYIDGRLQIGQEDCMKFIELNRIIVDGGSENAANSINHWPNVGVYRISGPSGFDSVKTRFMVNGKCVFRHDLDSDASEELQDDERELAIAYLADADFDAILISDYDKGFMTPNFIWTVIDIAVAKGVPVVADAKREPGIYKGAVLKCNIQYAKLFDVNPLDTPSYVITHGNMTPTVRENGMIVWRHPSRESKSCVNHVGAGDCFAAHLTLALSHGFSLEDAAELAHSSGRVYVQHPHNRAPWPHEISRDIDPCKGKIIDRNELIALRESIDGKIVFTNGVFRIGAHAGHAWLMQWAKQQGGTLVVGINDDESAARIRPGEMVLPFIERAKIFASMESVDWIIPFNENDPCAVLEFLGADVLVKGSEYAGTKVPGSDMIRDVRFAPEGPFPDRNASGIVAEIIDRHHGDNHHY